MGFTFYSTESRSLRANSMGYHTKSRDEIFIQQRERRAHESMDSRNITVREARDSEAHPNTVPIILGLDLTGSMGHIPHELVKDGLPTLMSKLIQRGVPDAALCFVGIGDHECDHHPLQAGQFESGDEELDLWLTRTYIESGGGGNAGESYPLAWEFALNRVVTDAWEKRNKKGFIITIGDEPFLRNFPKSALDEIYGGSSGLQSNVTAQELFEKASEKYEIYHIFVEHGYRHVDGGWRQLLGDHLIVTQDYQKVPDLIADTILKSLEKEIVAAQINQTSTIDEVEVETPAPSKLHTETPDML